MKDRLLLGFLACLYPALFFVSFNWYIYPLSHVFFLIIALPLLSAVFFLLLSQLFAFCFSRFMKEESAQLGKVKHVVDGFHALASIMFCILLFGRSIKLIQAPIFVILSVVVCVIAVVVWQAYRYGLRRLNLVLVMFAFFSLTQWAINISGSNQHESRWNEVNRSFNETIQFSKKSNVYYILTESHPNKEGLKEIFGFDNTAFYEKIYPSKLEKRLDRAINQLSNWSGSSNSPKFIPDAISKVFA